MRARPFIRQTCRVISLLPLSLLTLTPGAFGQTPAEDLFQQALRMERVAGDLEGAIRLYEQVVDTGDRVLGARALVRMAESYQKLGQEGARQAYARIIDEFGDQTEQVELARERLAALEGPAPEMAGEPSGITMRRVHRSVYGEDVPLAIAPNGTDLIYMDNWFGNLAVRSLLKGEPRDLTQDSSWSAWGGRVSPDGRTVVYLMAEPETSSIHLVGVDGSGARVLVREAGCPLWSPTWASDGESILAVRGCGDEGSEIVRISLPQGELDVVARIPGLEGLSLSPDDRFVIYDHAVPEDGGNLDIGMVSLANGKNIPLIRHPAYDHLLGWMPESDAVLFASDRDGTLDAWAIHVSEEGVEGPPQLLQRDLGQAQPLGFSRDGSFFFNRYKRWFSTGIAPFDLESGTVDMESGIGILGSNTPAVWSPDGKLLAFVPEIEGPKGSGGPYRRPLHIYDVVIGAKREFASHLQTRNPNWSPDGNFIIVSGRDTLRETEPFQGGLYTVDVRSGDVKEVMELDPETKTSYWADLMAVWSKDGQSIIYGTYDNAGEEGHLILRDLISGEDRVLFSDPNLASRQFALSPDGGRLVFGLRGPKEGYNDRIHSGGRLMIMDLDIRQVRELHRIQEEGRVNSLQWTPDGAHLLYTMRDFEPGVNRTHVWRALVEGGPAERTWTFPEDCFNAFLSLSPDGRQAAYTTYHQENEVWVMENLQEVLLRKTGG